MTNHLHPDAPKLLTRPIMLAELRGHLLKLAGLLALMLAVTGINVLSPLLFRQLVDQAIPAKDLGQIAWIALGIVLTPVAILGLLALQNNLRAFIGISVANVLRQKLFAHLLASQLSDLDRVKPSDMVYRLTRVCGQLGTVFVSDRLLPLVSSLFLLTGYLLVMFAVNWPLALLACVAVPLSYVMARWFTQHAYAADAGYLHNLEIGQNQAQEVFAGLRTVRAFGGEAYENGRWQTWLTENTRAYLHSFVSHQAYLFASEFIKSLLVGLVFAFGAWEVVQARLSLGALLTFVFYVPSAYAALRDIFQGQVGLGEARAAAEKLDSLFAMRPEPDKGQTIAPQPNSRIAVEFRDVSFTFGRDDFSLHHLSFRVEPGQLVGIVGASGGGKSTVLDLLMGFYAPQSGSILIDGVDLRELSLAALRQQIGLVPQDIFLWNASIQDNLLYPGGAADDDIFAAARQAQIHEWAAGLPQGYATVVGERGQAVSGGERQRLAICHALLRRPRLLLLDEATSALDALTESKLRDSIRAIRQACTTIIVAHRLSTILEADLILVLDQGRLVEAGPAADLLQQSGLFSRLYAAQRLDHGDHVI